MRLVRALGPALAASLALGCVAASRYHREVWTVDDRVSATLYYRQDLSRHYVAPSSHMVDIVVDHRAYRLRLDRFSLEDVYVACERVFVRILTNFGQFLTVLCDDGELAYVWDLKPLLSHPLALAEALQCTELENRHLELLLTYSTVVDGEEGEQQARYVVFEGDSWTPCRSPLRNR